MKRETPKTCAFCGAEFVDRSINRSAQYCGRKCRDRAAYAKNPDKMRARKRESYVANPERVLGPKRERYAKNLERERRAHREGAKARYAVNPDRRRERNREWRKENLEKERERKRAWRAANPDKVREHGRRTAKAHPESALERKDRRRARMRGAFIAPVDRKAIYKRDNYTCQLCGKKVKMDKKRPDPMSPSIDHILPLSKGGTHEPRKVQLTHLRCNLRKQNKGVDQLRLFGE